MPQWLFLEDFASPTRHHRAGDVIDDATNDLDRFIREGAALINYRPEVHDRPVAQFRTQRSQKPGLQLFPILAGAFVSGVVPSVTTRRIDLFVTTDGDDTRDGITSGTSLRTPQEAIDRVPDVLMHDVVIHVGNGTYPVPVIHGKSLPFGSLVIIGDGAGQIGSNNLPEDGFTVLLVPTAAAAGSNATNVTTSGLVANAFNGKTIEILTGGAAGDRRTIRDNTATVITPVQDFSAAVAATDTFRIVESAVFFTVQSAAFPGSPPAQISGVGTPVGNIDVAFTQSNEPALLLINLSFRADDLLINATFRIAGSRVVAAGIDFRVGTSILTLQVGSGAQLLLGVDTDGGVTGSEFQLPADLGLTASASSWLGWGLFFNDSFFLEACDVLGYFVFVGGRLQATPGAGMRLLGGAVHASLPIGLNMGGAWIIGQRSIVEIIPLTRPFIVRADVTGIAAAGIAVLSNSVLTVGNTEVTNTTSGHGILVGGEDFSDQSRGPIGSAEVHVINTCVIDTPGVALGASYGGSAYFNSSGPTVLNAPIQCATYTGTFGGVAVATTTFAGLTDGAAILAVPGDGTKIMRLPS